MNAHSTVEGVVTSGFRHPNQHHDTNGPSDGEAFAYALAWAPMFAFFTGFLAYMGLGCISGGHPFFGIIFCGMALAAAFFTLICAFVFIEPFVRFILSLLRKDSQHG